MAYRLIPATDDWQWLEAPEAPECLEWVDKQNASSKTHLDALPSARDLKKRLEDLASNDARCPDYFVAGDDLFRLRKTSENQEGVLEIADRGLKGDPDKWRTILDVDDLGRKENKKFQFAVHAMSGAVIGPSPRRLLLSLSVEGADTVELRELDIERGVVVEEGGFRTGEGRISAAWLDADHVIINHALNGGPTSKAGWPLSTYIWTRGTPLQSSKLVYQAEPTDSICVAQSSGTGEQRKGLIMRAIDYSTLVFYLVSADGSVEEIGLPRKISLSVSQPATQDHIFASVLESIEVRGVIVPSGTVIAYSTAPEVPADQRLSVVYTPGNGEVNSYNLTGGLGASRSRVYLILAKRGVDQRLTLELRQKSWVVVQREAVATGSHCLVVAGSSESDAVVLKQSGLTEPAKTWLEYADGTTRLLHKQASLFKSDDFVVEKNVARGKDGTEIDYFALYPKDAGQPAGGRPVLMTGYGAFGISFPVDYLGAFVGGISLVPWLESGGALVMPFIRGGGERGEEWHQAARQEQRQHSYDDFVAVTEKIIADGFTQPGRIGVFGLSNGGLLSAVMGTQRPDLFSAVVSDVPLTDMLRYPYIAMGAAWIYEYGDPEDPKMRKVLRSYSPFHNVKSDQKYPAFLITVSTRDDRVGAGHARKLAARLQAVGSPNSFFIEDREGGHSVSDPFKNVPLFTRRLGFLLKHVK